mgnify:CR=1 FL=1
MINDFLDNLAAEQHRKMHVENQRCDVCDMLCPCECADCDCRPSRP